MMKKESLPGHLSMFVASISWGAMAPLSKAVFMISSVGSLALSSWRIAGAAVAFWIASVFTPKEPVSRKDLLLMFLASLFAIVFNQGMFVIGISLTSPINASLITTTLPIMTMIIAAFWLKEPVTFKKLSGVLVGAAGAMLLIFNSIKPAGLSSPAGIEGDLLCLMAQFSCSIYFVMFQFLIRKYSPVTLMKWMFLFASICWLPFSWEELLAVHYKELPVVTYLQIGFIVLVGTFLSYILMSVAQKTLRPTVVTMYNYVQPIVASLVTVMWGMDAFGPEKLAAVVLVFTGVFIVTQSKARADMVAVPVKKDQVQ